jgi:predicted  nucleic acid-binding Zn-ribbon protein
MREKELYHQKRQAQLDGWKAELDLLKAKASAATAEAQLELHGEIAKLEAKIVEGQSRLAEIADASEEAWGSIKEGMDSAWASLKTAFKDASSKFKK